MNDIKWIKLYIEMFNSKKIKYLRKLPNGNDIVLIWVMLLAMAGKCNAGGMIFLTENIPYTSKMLADELDFEENVVILAIEALSKLGMINNQCDALSISNWEEYQNIDGMERLREYQKNYHREYRAKQKQLLLKNGIKKDTSETLRKVYAYSDVNALDKDIDKDIDNNKKEIYKEKISFDVDSAFLTFWNKYPRKTNKLGAQKAYAKAVKNEADAQKILVSLEAHKQSYDWKKENGRYIPYPATWLNAGGYLDETCNVTSENVYKRSEKECGIE